MEGISRKDLDRISQILSNHVNTDESIKLASKLTEFDAIPKLYVFTYFNKVYQELKQLKGEGSFDMEEVETLIESYDGLNLDFIKSKTDANKLMKFLSTGFERLNQFCDFDDSKYHGKTMMCQCQSEEHYEDIEYEKVLSKEDYAEYQKLCETDGGYDIAEEKFYEKLNPITECTPFYMPDDDTKKWKDEPIWTCKICSDRYDGGDGDWDVSCDMDMGL